MKGDPVKQLLNQIEELALAFYETPYRSALARDARDEEDLLMLFVFGEAMGIPNPVSYHTLELQPLLLERFHEWHRRMGLERSPFDQLRCC